MLRFACPGCKKVLQAPESNAGRLLACPHCQTRLRVPAPPQAFPEAIPIVQPQPSTPTVPVHEPPAEVDPELRRLLPPDAPVEALALGELMLRCECVTGSCCLVYVAAGGAILFGLGLLLVGLLTIGAIKSFGDFAISSSFLTIGAGMVVGSGWFIRAYWLQGVKESAYPNARILCKHGLIAIDDWKVTCCRWDDVTKIFVKMIDHVIHVKGVEVGTDPEYVYNVHGPDGLCIAFTPGTGNMIPALALLKQALLPRMLPRLWQQYESGQTLQFGTVQINKQGIMCQGTQVEWSRVRDVAAGGNFVVFNWDPQPADEYKPVINEDIMAVDNSPVLLAMIDEIRNNLPSQQL